MASISMHELHTLSTMLASNAAIDQSHLPRVSRTVVSSEHAKLCHPRELDRGTRHPFKPSSFNCIVTIFLQHHCICFYRR
jgi:hypothetical protein